MKLVLSFKFKPQTRQCLREKINYENHMRLQKTKKISSQSVTASTDSALSATSACSLYGIDEMSKLSIKLNFLKNEKKKRAIFKLNENMINVLKSDLRADRTAKIVKSGISFKHLAKLIKRGSDMNMMNRLVETKTMPLKGWGRNILQRNSVENIYSINYES